MSVPTSETSIPLSYIFIKRNRSYLMAGKMVEGILMMRSITPVCEEDIGPLIARLSTTLNLHHWDIKHRIINDGKMGNSLMKIIPTRARNAATIHISKSLLGCPTKDFVPLVLHELLHLVTDEIIEEHELQLAYEVSEHRLAEYNARFIRCFEKVIDQLTRTVARLIDILPEESLADTAPEVLAELTKVISETEREKNLIQGEKIEFEREQASHNS